MCIFENRFRITATYTAIISNLYLGTMVFYFSLAFVFLYLTIPIITLRTRWLYVSPQNAINELLYSKWWHLSWKSAYVWQIGTVDICDCSEWERGKERKRERKFSIKQSMWNAFVFFSLFVNHHPLVSCSTSEKNQIMAIHPRAFAVNISKFHSKLMWLSCDLSFYNIFLGKVLRLFLWRMMMRDAKWALKIVQKQSKQPKIR